MVFHVGLSDGISATALVLAVYSTMRTIRFSERQDKLNQLLIAKEQQQTSELKQADISAEFTKVDRAHHRLRVSNRGKAIAENVRLDLPRGNDHLPILNIDCLFPVLVLEPDQYVDLRAVRGMNSTPVLTIRFTWDDPSAKDREKTITIST
ncbi:MAG: hypothetical protein ABSD13_01385 [Candidatus Korobacteraceae bacterium]|jgi:hypothetical protein